MTVFDHLVIPLFVLFSAVEWLWAWPRTLRAIDAGVPRARLRAYLAIVAMEWAFVAYIVALWVVHLRKWSALKLTPGAGLGLAAGIALAAGYGVLAWFQRKALLARPDRLEQVFRSIGRGVYLIPHTPEEKRAFNAVAITAGICEEIVCRGFMIWYVGHWTGVAAAVAISSLVFGFGHIYLGVSHVLKTALVGAALALVVLASGALWPAMVMHAIQDLLAGDLGYRSLTAQSSKSVAT